MDVSTLLQQFEDLNHSERVRRMVELGTESKNNDTARETINVLNYGSLYEKALALETCYGSRNITIAQQALASSSRHLRKRALNLIGLLGTDEEFLDALRRVPNNLQIHTIRRFRDARRHRQRLRVIETFLEELEKTNRDPNLFRSLISLGSKEILERHLPGLIDGVSFRDWSELAKYHPDVAQKALQDWIDQSSEDEDLLVETVVHVLRQWMAHEYNIGRAVTLFKAAHKKISIDWLPVRELAGKRPKELFQILLDSDEDIEEHVLERLESRILRKLPLSQFLEVFKRYPFVIDSWNAPDSFDDLTIEQRKAVYKIVHVGWRNQGGIITQLSLEKLPREERILEARRHLTSSKFVTNPERKIKYVALLPWDEAVELQAPFLRSSDADTRASALKCQISATKFDDSHLNDALQLALARKNEQDPVKKEMIAGLVEIPASRWKESHLNDLGNILRNLLDTSDTSTWTLYSMTDLVTGIISYHPRWAAKQLATIIRERKPPLNRFWLSGYIPVKNVMEVLAEEMSPVLANLLKKKDGATLENIATAFDKMTKHWPELLDTCEKVLNDSEMKQHHTAMLNILKEHQPRSWNRVIPSLLAGNREVACEAVVLKYIHTREQKFLWSYLKSGDETKRDRRKALGHLSNSRVGFWRWTQTQQEALTTILLDECNDQELESDKKTSNIKQLSALAFVDPSHLINFANDDESPIVQEVALRSLGKLGGGQGVPVLIEALSDKRARIAIYALRTVLKSMPKAEVFSILKSVPQTKVTVAKETLRLIGELETDEAFTWLLEKGKESLHLDVRLALFKALLSFTDRDETWEFFEGVANDPEPDMVKIVATIPEDGLLSKAKERLLALLLQLLAHSDPVVRIAALRRCHSNPIHDPDNLLAPRLFELVHSDIKNEGEAASEAIFKTYATSNIELIRDTYRKLIHNRERLGFFHDQYWSVAYGRKKMFNPVTHMILDVLKEDRFSVKRRVKLMFDALYWPEIKPHIFEIVPELHADALVEAEKVIEENSTRWKTEKDDLLEAELEMAKSGDERARRLALSFLIGGVDENKGWKRAESDRLEIYKQDSSPLVAERAWEVEIDEEANDLDDKEST